MFSSGVLSGLTGARGTFWQWKDWPVILGPDPRIGLDWHRR
jgi:hypothetical protein